MRMIALSLCILGVGIGAFAQGAEQKKPNIVVLVADDLGYGECGCQGGKDIPTPHIDSIAKNGVRCTNGYVSCPVCSPTRAGLITGRYQQRFGHEFNPGPPQQAEKNFGLPLTEKPFPTYLKEAGYVTGMVGKWHLGYRDDYQPPRRGFDEFFGFLGGAHPYLPNRPTPANPIMRDGKAVEEKAYLTDAFAREAAAFITKHQKEPFFLYLPFNGVHAPIQPAPRHAGLFGDIKDEKRRKFASMLTAVDEAVGVVLDTLKKTGTLNNTLVFFISDNGGPTKQTTSRNDPLRGFKGQVFEGGIRVPFLVQYPGHLPAGKTYEQPVIALDILPTALAAAGGKVPEKIKLDGVNLLPYLQGENKKAPHEILTWRFGQQWAIRKGNWKLLKTGKMAPMLFDLSTDLGESKDLAADKPEIVKELQKDYDAWNSQLSKPLWQRPRQQ